LLANDNNVTNSDGPSSAPPNFRWIEPGKLAGSGYLSRPANIAWLVGEGVGAIISAARIPAAVQTEIEQLQIRYLDLPVPDFDVPTDAQIERFIRFVEDSVAFGVTVLVHCVAGVGRTGTLGALWLVHRGVGAGEALERVGVETSTQSALVRRWEERVLARSDDAEPPV
jgi:atypical dual specificity phosphatase